MSERAKEFTKDGGAKMITQTGTSQALSPVCGARPDDLKKMFMNEVMADFENNMSDSVRPGCGMPLTEMHKVFGKELAAMLPNALAAKSPSAEQMFVIEQAYLKLQEHNKDAKPQTNVFADMAKQMMPNKNPIKINISAKVKGMER